MDERKLKTVAILAATHLAVAYLTVGVVLFLWARPLMVEEGWSARKQTSAAVEVILRWPEFIRRTLEPSNG